MKAASQAIQHRADARLLVINDSKIEHHQFRDIAAQLAANDLIVVNDAATIPASFFGRHRATGAPIELRLAIGIRPPWQWQATLFGSGDWRTATEHRPASPTVAIGDQFDFCCGLSATVTNVSRLSPRFVGIKFATNDDEIWSKLYRAGDPIQYSYLNSKLEIWDQQTVFSGPPAALEPPSASFPFSWQLIFELKRRGIAIARLTHSAGISTTGDARLDARLPFPERYLIPSETAVMINSALQDQRRIIAIGTSVTRALESAVDNNGKIRAGAGIAHLKISAAYQRRVVNGILTGMHEAGASHLDLLASFTDSSLLQTAYQQARERGYLWHEYGDSCLILPGKESGSYHPLYAGENFLCNIKRNIRGD